jgi:hypothetical protein
MMFPSGSAACAKVTTSVTGGKVVLPPACSTPSMTGCSSSTVTQKIGRRQPSGTVAMPPAQ